jgi:hypothetical protein
VTSTTSSATRPADSGSDVSHVDGARAVRRSTETKASTKTTEFLVYLAAVAASDPFSALDAIRYISYLTIGYMIARGLAKSGSRDPYTAEGPSKH